ncbi:rod-binding protein [Vibrio harveyi]|nr:rod-binding protein [Vibrio harveyi]
MMSPVIPQTLFNDTNSIQSIKSNEDKNEALKQASEQFEALFLQTVLKHMRSATEALENEDSILGSKQQKFYREMLDGQLAVEMSKLHSLGIANLIMHQIGSKEDIKDDKIMVVNEIER